MSSFTNQDAAPDMQEISYRAVSKAAICSLILALVSIASVLFPPALIFSLGALLLGIVALANIRRYPDELSGKVPAVIGVVLGVSSLVLGTATNVYVYLTEVPEGYERVSFYDLEPEPGARTPITEKAVALKDKNVFIKGYVHPGVSSYGDVDKFVLVKDWGTCCFGGQPKLYHMVEVNLTGGKKVQYSRSQIRVGGKFLLNDRVKAAVGGIDGGYYRLDADYVK